MTVIRRHATTVSIDALGSIMIEGPSGSGKSTIALGLLESFGAKLVADDQTLLLPQDDGSFLPDCPTQIRGFLEVRGIGLVPYDVARPPLPLALLVRINPEVALKPAERLPVIAPITKIGDQAIPTLILAGPGYGVAERILAALRHSLHMRPVDAKFPDQANGPTNNRIYKTAPHHE